MAVTSASTDPDYINYLLNPKKQYECYFVVGNPDLNTPPEKIGVVKEMLMAHSVVLRAELKESRLAEKEIVKVEDLFPDTVKLMLRYVYGYDTTKTLCFDDADNLLYAAEKYLITSLRDKLVKRLMDLLSYENICGLMNNPVCKQMLELNSAMNKILQNNTDKILASPQFLGLSPDAFLTILQQEMVNVPEVELWRSAVRWAKNRVGSNDSEIMRKELSQHVKHLRICTLTSEEFCEEVLPEKILTYEEIALVGLCHKTGEQQLSLTTICNSISKRMSPRTVSEPMYADFFPYTKTYYECNQSLVNINTKDYMLELTSLVLYSCNNQPHNCEVTVKIKNEDNGTSLSIQASREVGLDEDFTVDLIDRGQPVELLDNTTYTITIMFCDPINHYLFSTDRDCYIFDHFSVDSSYSPFYYKSHIEQIIYKTISSS